MTDMHEDTGYLWNSEDEFQEFGRRLGIKCCVICGNWVLKKFPESFPDEWKFCCNCLGIAEYTLHLRTISGLTIPLYGFKETIKKVRDKITVV